MLLYNVIEKTELFDFDYDFYDDSKKDEIEQMFISHYLMHEIASNTILEFKRKLEHTWKLKLKKYNKSFELINTNIDVLNNVDIDIENNQKFMDTPISEIVNLDDYMTTATINKGKNKGYSNITQVELINKYVKDLDNLYEKFLDEFYDLFMLVYN